MNFLLANRLSLGALLSMFVASALLWNGLPEQVPAHFNFQGDVDDYRSREVMAILMPVVFVSLLLAVNILMRISPKKFSMPNSKHAMDIIVFGIGVMMLFMHIGMLINNGDFDRFVEILGYGIAAFLIITGNVFGKTERNFFIGLRTPWTIASHANWKATHRFAGRLMVGSGGLMLLINLFYSNIFLILALCVAPLIAPVFFSVLYYLRNEKDKTEPGD